MYHLDTIDILLFIAEQALSYAFRRCPIECARNKRLILMYLIPVKMFLGHMPTEHLLESYALMQFSQVAQSVKYAFVFLSLYFAFREGNLLKLETALNEHEQFFIECGIFLMLEKLKTITYRTLFKTV